MKLTIEINLDNAAFEHNNAIEAHECINRWMTRMESVVTRSPDPMKPGDSWPLFDVNGNKCGTARVSRTRPKKASTK